METNPYSNLMSWSLARSEVSKICQIQEHLMKIVYRSLVLSTAKHWSKLRRPLRWNGGCHIMVKRRTTEWQNGEERIYESSKATEWTCEGWIATEHNIWQLKCREVVSPQRREEEFATPPQTKQKQKPRERRSEPAGQNYAQQQPAQGNTHSDVTHRHSTHSERMRRDRRWCTICFTGKPHIPIDLKTRTTATSYLQTRTSLQTAQEYAIYRIVWYNGKESNSKDVILLYGYTYEEDTAEPSKHIPHHFITSNWRCVLRKIGRKTIDKA